MCAAAPDLPAPASTGEPGADAAIIPFGATVQLPARLPPARTDPAAPFELLFVGRLVERKGVHLLLRWRPFRRSAPREDVEAGFSWEVIVGRLAEVYRRVAGR